MPKFIGIDISGYRISQYVDLADPTHLPFGTLSCDGSAISRTLYSKLFAVIGITYGPGDGTTTFNIPDRRGRGLIGDGTGPSLSARAVGQSVGEETHQLTVPEMPSHSHSASTSGSVPNTSFDTGTGYGGGGLTPVKENTGSALPISASTSIGNTGGDGAHNNVQPSLVSKQAIAYI